tara:strand:+ start:173 stop:454 length:282 start_codon:yes stop_codon:yes gene_type:complete
MTPTIAISMLSVATFKRPSQQFGLPLLIMVITDAVIGFHSLVLVVYLSIALAGMAGYVAAIPFFHNTLIATVGVVFIVFGLKKILVKVITKPF